VWEKVVFSRLLSSVIVQVDVPDHWQWLPDVVGGYSVHSSYQVLTTQDPPMQHTSENLIWHSQVPLKVPF
jgi:hypothetical protein